MKKLLFFFGIALFSFTAVNAQSVVKPLQSDVTVHKAGLDTVTNAASVSQVLQIPGNPAIITIQAAVTKLTGSPGGSVKLYGSVDGVRYDFATTSTDTLAVANVAGAQVKTWKLTGNAFQYYKAIYKSNNSSQTSTVSNAALIRGK
ncbi:hypothetical protein [Mucilaginibacter sp. L3T2-6]|uniref:hypothetical protein n=1 Tax=Mucilaginibacter sp. L3T2-6 TaxID=3062491 RepID=UPI002676D061|nr:hypothetical protein [Mucilaginibacter sp. L3T2-6]MDO3641973.1 hypothetical protein [Mucilaginibacter sp. L3T2-6]MDV6214349.1 hypothetical protein [Mucilaginibacter sp. L3T2-6]